MRPETFALSALALILELSAPSASLSFQRNYEEFSRGPYGYQLPLRRPQGIYTGSSDARETKVQQHAPWGLARISHRDSLNENTRDEYLYDASGTTDVNVYVINTGVNVFHPDLRGRVLLGKNTAGLGFSIDRDGEGTHVAGTIAGTFNGVAKKANIIAVKAMQTTADANITDVLAGLRWATDHHKHHQTLGHLPRASVAVLHLPPPPRPGMPGTVDAAILAGIHVVLPAGNANLEIACPAEGAPNGNAIVAAASNVQDEKAGFSNYGPCIDIFAPGSEIASAGYNLGSGLSVKSGTEMAAAHVAGLIAYLLGLRRKHGIFDTPEGMKKLIAEVATEGVLKLEGNSTFNVSVHCPLKGKVLLC